MIQKIKINKIVAKVSPKLPKSRSDPIMGNKLLGRSLKLINEKYKLIKKEVVDLFSEIPSGKITNNYDYFYLIDAARMGLINQRILDILDKFLIEGYPLNLFWSGVIVQEAYQYGTGLAQSNLAAMSAIYATERSLSVILMSDSYRLRIGLAYSRSYESWKGLSDKTKSKLADIISEAIASGQNPKYVVDLIIESLNVSKSEAENIAQTEITGTLRQARWDESDDARKILGLDTAIFWTSALLPTTRITHAARHGLIFSTDNVREFYGKNGNRYRCHCGNTEVILINGQPDLSARITDQYKEEKKQWDRDHEAK